MPSTAVACSSEKIKNPQYCIILSKIKVPIRFFLQNCDRIFCFEKWKIFRKILKFTSIGHVVLSRVAKLFNVQNQELGHSAVILMFYRES